MSDAYTGLVQIVAKIGSDVVARTTNKTGGSQPKAGKTLAAAIAGTLTTRTNDTQGIVTSTGHNLTDADTVALFFTGGKAYDCEITSYDANTITFTVQGDDSDVLPAEDSAVTIATAEDVTQEFSIDGDSVDLLMGKATSITADGLIILYEIVGTAETEVLLMEDLSSTTPYVWPQTAAELAAGQPFSETVTKARFYNGDTVAGTLEVIALS